MSTNPRHPALKWTSLALCLIACALAFFGVRRPHNPTSFAFPRHPIRIDKTAPKDPIFETRSVTTGTSPSVHCATAVSLPDHRIFACWFGGTKEGASDVSIWSSVFDPNSATWSKERELITREWTAKQLHRNIRKIGNPVLHLDKSQNLWLFYVTVSVGGWSGSSINLVKSTDHGETWSPPRRLITSPFFNFATLGRQPVVPYRDGTIGLPVHQEFIGNFCEILRLDQQGNIIDRSRLTRGRRYIQPLVLPKTDTIAFALMRDFVGGTHHIGMIKTQDGGNSWTAPVDLDLPNPSAALGGVQLDDGRFLLAFNNSKTSRNNLELAISPGDPAIWHPVTRLEGPDSVANDKDNRYAYPWLLLDDNDSIHLLYTNNRKAITHLRFNAEWIDQQLKGEPAP